MNVKGLREVGRFIVEHPENFTMGMPCERIEGACACIAVWTCWLVGMECRAWQDYQSEARRILDLSIREGEDLFYAQSWPDLYKFRQWLTWDIEERAKIANQVIEHVIRNRERKR